MEVQPELSLGMSAPAAGFAVVKSPRSSSSDSDGSGGKKRKHFAWREEAMSHASGLELQLGDPLPPDWEQCLDLHSGRMYYLNRKTMKKSWVRPRSSNKEEQGALNLELNISTTPSIFDGKASSIGAAVADETRSPNGGGHMVAVPCANCHLLVMLCKSSPSCPNCKFVQPSVPAMPRTPPRRLDAVKPLETLSLLH
ncbi:hypothetical protein SEVIR_8G110100v4 [Setaria viridis]|uniref:WW domain-containing protein n=2 Tax=Setaria TaxID=4554 RepID=K3ZJX9_SETIT|nr:uncharacterized protein LOC101757522 [Setaria italica]XP_034606814.1 uncharacterized protein LOC117866644 [Setaria viridis]RCV38000.1 hypothetical protein SETIT_8G107000v2 [Setaria italica]TKW00455.1 hypothetical protein SEVIR_8G110100v2 [Setaria viridis]